MCCGGSMRSERMTDGEIFGGWSWVELMTTVQIGPPPDKLAMPSWFIDICNGEDWNWWLARVPYDLVDMCSNPSHKLLLPTMKI